MWFFILLGVIVWIALDVAIANQFAFAAKEKGYTDDKYFWWSFWLGLIGWLMVIALPTKTIAQTASVSAPSTDAIHEEEIPEI